MKNLIVQPGEGLSAGATARSRPGVWIAGTVVGALVLLTTGGLFAVPGFVHQVEVSEYGEVTSRLVELDLEIADLSAEIAATTALLDAQYEDAAVFLDGVEHLASSAEPVLLAGHATALSQASEQLAGILKSAPPTDNGARALRAAAQAQTAAAVGARTVAQSDTVSLPFLAMKVEEARALAFPVAEPTARHFVADEQVNVEALAETRQQLEHAERTLTEREAELRSCRAESRGLLAAVSETVPALEDAVRAAPAQALLVIEAAGQAGDTSQFTAVAKSAVLAVNTNPVALHDALLAYVRAAASVRAAHDAAVAAEAAASAAAAAGATGYVDPSTGQWTPMNLGAGAGATGGDWSGSSGSAPPTGGAGTVTPPTGGGSAPVGGEGGGIDPNDCSTWPSGCGCPAPPAGWTPTGGTANGCPTYAPPSDEWG